MEPLEEETCMDPLPTNYNDPGFAKGHLSALKGGKYAAIRIFLS
jgi:hypothetical protein